MDKEVVDAENMERELDIAFESMTEDAELGELALLHDRLRAVIKVAEEKKDELAKRITARMESLGLDSVKAGGRRLAFREQTFYGIAEGHVQEAKDFLEAVAPEVNVPASTNIKKAVDAYLDENPGAAIPAFISVTKTRSLVNAKG